MQSRSRVSSLLPIGLGEFLQYEHIVSRYSLFWKQHLVEHTDELLSHVTLRKYVLLDNPLTCLVAA